MKKAFTLVELLVVIGLMSVLATMSIGGYSAITRGMSDRAALDAAKSIADAALQRAQLDRTRTYLYLFNEVMKVDTEMSAGICQGVIIAVRPTGRITGVAGNLYLDEFNLEKVESTSIREEQSGGSGDEEESATITRIYSIAQRDFMNVYEGNFRKSGGQNLDEFGSSNSDDSESGRTIDIYGFKKKDGGATFNTGDLYGQEFAVTRLPPNYVFSSSVNMRGSSSLGQTLVNAYSIEATDDSVPAISIYRRRPDGTFEPIGSTMNVKDGK